MKKHFLFSLFLIVGFNFIMLNVIAQEHPFSGGMGTAEDPYQIETRAQLDSIRNRLGEGWKDVHYKLMNDIDLSGEPWTPIGAITGNSNINRFCGKLHGNDKKITEISIIPEEYPYFGYAGLFAGLYNGAYIDSLHLEGGDISTYYYGGGIAARIEISAREDSDSIKVFSCSSSVNIKPFEERECRVGGIVGSISCESDNNGKVIIENCKSFVNFYETRNTTNIGGILGEIIAKKNDEVYVKNCVNYGNIENNYDNSKLAGICSYINSGAEDGQSIIRFENCRNFGNINSTINNSTIGGIVAIAASLGSGSINGYGYIMNCINYGEISLEGDYNKIGGLVGDIWVYNFPNNGITKIDITNSYSYANIFSIGLNAEIGGILGYVATESLGDGKVNIENTYSYGKIEVLGQGSTVGGIIGKTEVYIPGDFISIKNSVSILKSIKNTNGTTNRILGEGPCVLENNYANSSMKINGAPVGGNPSSTSNNGANKTLEDLYKRITFTDNLGWDFTDIWEIRDDNINVPYFKWQSAPVYVEELLLNNTKINVYEDSENIIIFEDFILDPYTEIENPNQGIHNYGVDLTTYNFGDTLKFVNYEENKIGSYPVYSEIQRLGTITITADNLSKCYGTNDPELTYTLGSELPSGVNIIGQLGRAQGEESGNYSINIGTLATNNINYEIAFNPGVFSIFKVDTSISIENKVLTANATEATFQWLDCDNENSHIENATANTFTPEKTGNYAVEVTQNSCVDTSECTNVIISGIKGNTSLNDITIYPNPTEGKFSVDLGNSYKNINASIYDQTGKLINEIKFSGTQIINLEINEPAGLYFVNIKTDDNSQVSLRIIKK